ncbi:CopD family protein [Ensifer adhaerens]|uniref:CopD family protein n=1 Tax=Ensifer adhaerens TaxID=106592 RepID=UPI00098F25D7|nr:CopD family protein [Ensifer adhaerens]
MLELIFPYYLWIKAAHVASVVLWLGGQCLLVVLLSSQRQMLAENGDAAFLSVVVQRGLRQVVNPAMLATLLVGATLFFLRGAETLGEPWFQVKLVCVLAMTALHGAISGTAASLRRGNGKVSAFRVRCLQVSSFALTIAIIFPAIIK